MDYAIVVGINRYPNVKPSRDLDGCVNDAHCMAEFLSKGLGSVFSPVDVMKILDESATRTRILGELANLVRVLKAGDCCAFHFSGHGTISTGREAEDAIVPHDYWPSRHDETIIARSDFEHILAEIPQGAYLFWTSDSCHSGSLTRGLEVGAPDKKRHKTRYLAPPPGSLCGNAHELVAVRETTPRRRVMEHVRGVFAAACQSSEEALDGVAENPGGVFTNALINVLRKPGSGERKVAEWFVDVERDVEHQAARMEHEQHPECRGDRALHSRKLFDCGN